MDAANCALAAELVSRSYVDQGAAALAARRRQVRALLSNRRLPAHGWDEATIEMLLQDAALMDSNTFPGQVGLGEREARVACPLVARRHGRLAHGIGRSGDVTAEQPKAAGSSLLAKLAASLAADALRLAGLGEQGPAVVLPCATGMALTLVLLAAADRPPAQTAAAAAPGSSTQPEQQQQQQRRYVIWSRIDQKTCLKAITAANLAPVVVELLRDGDQLTTDVPGIAAALQRLGPDAVAAVVTTTSCFAPRAADDVVAVAKLCAVHGVTHVVNNAYGLQSAAIMAALTTACRRGRVDAIVQSTDKNFMVPVGGAIITAPAAAPRSQGSTGSSSSNTGTSAGSSGTRGRSSTGGGWLVDAVAQRYPGRAGLTPLLDLLTTLLFWGAAGWQAALAAREDLYGYLKQQLAAAAQELGERVLETPGNPISLAMTLDGLTAAAPATAAGRSGGKAALQAGRRADVGFFGAMLWARNVSGTRVLAGGKAATVGGVAFQDYGTHTAGYPHAYLTAAAAIGGSRAEVDVFTARLVKAYRELHASWTQQQAAGSHEDDDGEEAAAAAAEDGGAAAGTDA